MGAKVLLYDEEARKSMLKGVNTLADAVKVTSAPKAATLLLIKLWFTHCHQKTAFTVAKEIELER